MSKARSGGPARPKASGAKAPRPRAKGGGKPRRSGGGGGSPVRRAAIWTLRLTLAILLGVVSGGGIVVGALYRAALEDVDTVVSGPVWTRSGRVMSGAQEVWPGLQLSAEELAEDLGAAGFSRVAKASKPGDMSVSGDAVMAVLKGDKEPLEVLVTFQGGRVSTVSPRGRASFPAAELAVVRGPDNDARRPVPLDGMPKTVVNAVLAMEDARFYSHEGVDPIGVARALFVNLFRGETMQGGSTLTQQLAKNLFLSQERTWQRKAREALFALALERRMSKDELLELYLNGVYLGQASGASIYGVDQASRAFFGHAVDRLELGEAATIAGIISAPNRYSPLSYPDRAQERRDLALSRMVDTGAVDAATADKEKKRGLQTHPAAGGRRAPWAVDSATETVEEALGAGSVAARGLVVSTTIQPALQRLAEHAVATSMAELAASDPRLAKAEMALVAVRVSDGAVVAAVGGRDYSHSPFNRAFQAKRQIGSTVKPLTLAKAFEDRPGLSPATLVIDEPIERKVDGKIWRPKNYDGQFQGEMTVRHAITASRNIPAVLLSEDVGMDRLASFWTGLGLSGANAWPSSALGAFGATPLELAGAYTIFPGGGKESTPMLVRRATDPDGALLWSAEPSRATKISDRASFLTVQVLEDVIRSGTGKDAARFGVTGGVGGKTGTTDDARDAWFAGFTRDLVVVVWVGFDRDEALGLGGSKAALPAWSRFVAGLGPSPEFQPPASVESAPVCAESGQPASNACPSTQIEWFSRGSVPDNTCPLHTPPLQQVGAAASDAWQSFKEHMGGDRKRPLQRLFGRREPDAPAQPEATPPSTEPTNSLPGVPSN